VGNDGVASVDRFGLIAAHFDPSFGITLERKALMTYIFGWESPTTLGSLFFEVNIRCTEDDESPAGRLIGDWKVNSAWIKNPPVSHSNIPNMLGLSGLLNDETPTIRVDLEAVAGDRWAATAQGAAAGTVLGAAYGAATSIPAGGAGAGPAAAGGFITGAIGGAIFGQDSLALLTYLVTYSCECVESEGYPEETWYVREKRAKTKNVTGGRLYWNTPYAK
jgi:hypothetical protein